MDVPPPHVPGRLFGYLDGETGLPRIRNRCAVGKDGCYEAEDRQDRETKRRRENTTGNTHGTTPSRPGRWEREVGRILGVSDGKSKYY